MNTTDTASKTKDMVYISMFAILIAICSWISIPAAVPFTFQTMGIFLAVGILGGKRGTISVFIYILLGMVGLPVFSGFKGGIAALVGPTGGYIIGFLFSALLMWGIEKRSAKNGITLLISMILGLLVCYVFGTIWFMKIYSATNGAVGIGTVLGWCVIPFIIPDCVKIVIAFILTNRIKKVVHV